MPGIEPGVINYHDNIYPILNFFKLFINMIQLLIINNNSCSLVPFINIFWLWWESNPHIK